MSNHVRSKVLSLLEGAWTLIALERSFTRVDAHVLFHCGPMRESFVTILTFHRFLAQMNALKISS